MPDVKVTPILKPVVRGITIEFTNQDDISHFSYLLGTWKSNTGKNYRQGGWNWLKKLAEDFDAARYADKEK
jgi:hypothetical protein